VFTPVLEDEYEREDDIFLLILLVLVLVLVLGCFPIIHLTPKINVSFANYLRDPTLAEALDLLVQITPPHLNRLSGFCDIVLVL